MFILVFIIFFENETFLFIFWTQLDFLLSFLLLLSKKENNFPWENSSPDTIFTLHALQFSSLRDEGCEDKMEFGMKSVNTEGSSSFWLQRVAKSRLPDTQKPKTRTHKTWKKSKILKKEWNIKKFTTNFYFRAEKKLSHLQKYSVFPMSFWMKRRRREWNQENVHSMSTSQLHVEGRIFHIVNSNRTALRCSVRFTVVWHTNQLF